MTRAEKAEKYFYEGYCELVHRRGDFYVARRDNCWSFIAGVSSSGHNPGGGACCNISCDSEEFNNFEK